jgi:glutamate:Na+ symporter, ESS family
MDRSFLGAWLLACGLLAAGLTLRLTVRALRRLFIPASVVAGVIGFVLFQTAARIPAVALTAQTLANRFSTWPAWLVAVVFAGLLLERRSDSSFKQAIQRGARSAAVAWIIILGQILIGLIVFVLLVRPREPAAPACAAQLLEISWAGGPGSAAAMGQLYTALGFPQGGDLALFLATLGLIWGVISGLFLVNLAIRRRWTHARFSANAIDAATGVEPAGQPIPAAYAKTRSDVIDPLALQVLILTAAFAAGYVLQQGFLLAWQAVFAMPRDVLFVSNIPLFLFTLLGGLIVRRAMEALRIGFLIDGLSIQRLVGVAMEFLIVSAVASIRIESLRSFLLPVVALVVLAALWCAFCLLWVARRLLPAEYWFELGLLNYGFSTANTPQGMMLLRIVDPRLESGAAEDYAVAAPLSAPFVGGGVLSFTVLPAMLQRVPAGWMMIVLIAAMLAIYFAGRRFLKPPS